jgi:uncharacterized integral membrane protein
MPKLILSTLVLIILVIFMAANANQRVSLHLIFTTLNDFPVALACLLFMVLGMIGGMPFFLFDRLNLIKKQKQEIRRLTTYLETTRNELKEAQKKSANPQSPQSER